MSRKVYLIFISRSHDGLHHVTFPSLEQAWYGAKIITQEYHKAGGRNLQMLHATFQEFLSSPRPEGCDSPNTFIPEWIWGDYGSGDSETRRVMGNAFIKEMSVPE